MNKEKNSEKKNGEMWEKTIKKNGQLRWCGGGRMVGGRPGCMCQVGGTSPGPCAQVMDGAAWCAAVGMVSGTD